MKRFTFLLLNIMAFSIISFIEAKADTNEVVKYYTRTGIQKHDGGERVITHEQNGGAIFTFKANNIVTVQKLISESFVENEIEAKGTLSADGKTITFEKQVVGMTNRIGHYNPESGEWEPISAKVCISMAKLARRTIDGIEKDTYVEDPDTPISLTVDGDEIRLNNSSEEKVLAYILECPDCPEYDKTYYAFGDCNTVFTQFKEEGIKLPENLKPQTYVMSYEEVYNDNNSKFASVAFDGDDVYLNTQMYFKNSWIKGKKSGNIITFPTGQFLGYDGQDFYYAIAIKYEMDYYSWSETQKYINYYYAPEFSLTYNPDTKVLMYADQNVGFGITNANGFSEEYIYPYTFFGKPVLTPYADKAATPLEAQNFTYGFYDNTTYRISFDYPDCDAEGYKLNPEQCFFKVFCDDDKEYVFTVKDYPELSEDKTELGWDDFIDYNATHAFLFPMKQFKRVGIQTIYKGGGEERASEISYIYFELLPGDANGDGMIDVADITATAADILGNPGKDFNPANADANGDGFVDVADITAIASTILKPTPEQLYVDLGLPSGIKWAKCNLGANSPEEPGGYYSWGETKTKDEYSWATYPDATDGRGYAFAKYYIEGGKTVLDPEDDAVRVIMGGDWRMPTLAEITELMDNCVAIGATLKGVEGVKMVSKKNGKSIFIPTIGYYFEKDFYSGSYIWATDICETSNWYAYAIGFSSGYAYITSYYRIAGCNIRPVCK